MQEKRDWHRSMLLMTVTLPWPRMPLLTVWTALNSILYSEVSMWEDVVAVDRKYWDVLSAWVAQGILACQGGSERWYCCLGHAEKMGLSKRANEQICYGGEGSLLLAYQWLKKPDCWFLQISFPENGFSSPCFQPLCQVRRRHPGGPHESTPGCRAMPLCMAMLHLLSLKVSFL